VPFIPYGIALEISHDQATQAAFFVGGLMLAVPWFLYVIWRGLRLVGRSFRQSATLLQDSPPPMWRCVAGLAVMICGGLVIYIHHFS
jgi:hypothetical protein